MSIYMTVQGDGGSPIRSIIDDMLALANRVGISVWCTCNDVRVLVQPGDDAEKIWKEWQVVSEEMSIPTGARGADWADEKATEVVLEGMENGRLRETIAAALREAERRGAERMRAAAANKADKHGELAIGGAILALSIATLAEQQETTEPHA